MNRSIALALATTLATTACAREKPYTAPTPWEAGTVKTAGIAGSFRAELGSPHPGAGAFQVLAIPYGDMARVRVEDVGATWRVVQLELMDHSPEGWRVLELDVAENLWIAGVIPVDGTAASGTLTEPDGTVSYLLGGQIELELAGLGDGQIVSGTFSGIDLVEVR